MLRLKAAVEPYIEPEVERRVRAVCSGLGITLTVQPAVPARLEADAVAPTQPEPEDTTEPTDLDDTESDTGWCERCDANVSRDDLQVVVSRVVLKKEVA